MRRVGKKRVFPIRAPPPPPNHSTPMVNYHDCGAIGYMNKKLGGRGAKIRHEKTAHKNRIFSVCAPPPPVHCTPPITEHVLFHIKL